MIGKGLRMIIVTGGAGFIGSALIAALNKRGIDDILVVDRLGSDQRWKNLVNLRFADYLDKEEFLEMVAEDVLPFSAEAVFHLGACSSTTETDASFLMENNFEYTRQLAQWTTEEGIRFIYASSAATYGDGENGFADDESELETLKPLNPYGYSKQLFDLWAKRNCLLGKIAGLKYFNIFGPNEYHKADMRSFVLKGFQQIKQTGKVRLFKSYNPQYPDGWQMRDFLYVKDAVDMTLFFLDNKKAAGIFNIGAGLPRTWLDLAGALFTAMNIQPNIEFIDMPVQIRDKYQYFTQADITKLRKAGYDKQPAVLEIAVKDYVQNYLKSDSYLSASAF